MKVHLALDLKGINQQYHLPLWTRGAKELGWDITNIEDADIIVMWGVTPPTPLEHGRDKNKPVLVLDFPYWNRGGKNRDGREYYKVSINGQHPTKYVMKENHSSERYNNTNGMGITPWKQDGSKIMFAGTGQKAAKQFGYETGEWEAKMIALIKTQTDMPIIYRPKPRQGANPIPGTIFDDGSMPMERALEDVKSVCCHHGNPTVTALAMGIPIFMNGPIGVASHFASFDFSKINEPIRPDGREQFLYNLAHWQWSVSEITSGIALKSYYDRGFFGDEAI